jgi:hypothetical protein
VALGLIIWVIRLLILDPRGVIRGALFRRSEDEQAERGLPYADRHGC